ncbi:MarR family winged helix-turn-helix transcriptional regulator [Paenibacillus camerounensis]|uniref:MarR family winged helix-turn-helix transcriptional regulator n=1 Tax=Paenibacillus camerounensis TaxID=1243663 RepID=UPI0005AB828D|nr:MarR family transcriptional regulator [Paenibacillus camerounensis]
MKEHSYDNADALMGAFQQFSRLNWQKTAMFGLKPSEIRVLITIHTGKKRSGTDTLTVSEVSRLLRVTSPTITQMVNSLLSQGLVERSTSSQDRRISALQLTEQGEILADKAIAKIRDTFKGMIDHLGEDKSSQLIGLLNEVHAYFEQLNGEPDCS